MTAASSPSYDLLVNLAGRQNGGLMQWRRPARMPSDPDRFVRTLGRVLSAVTAVLALAAVLGWALNAPALRQLSPSVPTIKINTAVAMLSLAVAYLVGRRLAVVLGGVVALIGLLTFVEIAGGVDLGIDQLLHADPGASSHPGRMSLVTASGLLAIACATICWKLGRPKPAQALAFASLAAGVLSLLGYLYDVPTLYRVEQVSTIAVPTGIGLVLLSVALLAGVPRGALVWLIASQDAGTPLLRRLVPLALVGLPVVGFIALQGQRADWFAPSTTAAVIVVVSAVLIGAFAWTAAVRVTRADRRRGNAIEDLTSLRDDLERQVTERAEQLQSRRNEIAVLEDRQRIAADLHDIVIQRLFAAGMYLQGGTIVASDADTRRRVDAVVEAMDTAIKDLRASIFQLGGGRDMMRADLTSALDNVCTESARVLGFTPDLLVDDPELQAERAYEDILAVVREALANVARHAAASAVIVEVRTGADEVVVCVSDNGQGMSAPPHRSGTRNMVDRARGHGGTCTWTPAEPQGTCVEWRIPVVAIEVVG